MEQISLDYSQKMQHILWYHYEKHVDILTLKKQFRGKEEKGIYYNSGSLLHRNTINDILQSIQKGKLLYFIAFYFITFLYNYI